ncbi:response regulator transcription factor [Cohnella hongkongensis]|uniref:Helix-turn-helix domain-containing protein n=1 Tax=Cohnella hongkongensis TaxID=178337 RepID=A0ABV9FG56_9BACL
MNPVKVMLVDDEVLAIEHMRGLISWPSLGYEIVCTATKPAEALRLAREHRPELVILDIVMPGMDGLALGKELIAEGTVLKVVLLTSYKEFEYAKEALKLGVSNYWVKHEMDGEAVKRELGGLREEIERERRARKNDRGRLLVDWLGGRELSDEQWRMATSGLGSRFDRLHLLVLQPDRPFPALPEASSAAPRLPSEWPEEEEEGLLAAVRFLEGHYVLVYGDSGSRGEGKMRETIERRTAEGQRMLERLTGSTVSAATAYGLTSRTEVPGKLADALKLLERTIFYGPRTLFRLNDLWREEPAAGSRWDWEEEAAGIRERIAARQYREAAERLAASLARAAEEKDPAALAGLCRQTAAALDRGRAARGLPSLAQARTGEPGEKTDWTSLEGLRDWLLAETEALAAADAPRSSMSRKVRQALEYLERHYADPDVDTDTVARDIGLSRDHLRHVFKEETGSTVQARLTDIRMDRAKRLLDEGALKVYEVAERVGYRNGQYFSQVFRKTTGMTPLDYMEKRR